LSRRFCFGSGVYVVGAGSNDGAEALAAFILELHYQGKPGRKTGMKSIAFSGLIVRPFQPGDADAIMEITKAAWDGVTMAELREKQLGLVEGKPWREHKAGSVLAQCQRRPDWALVGLVNGEIIGYATMSLSPGGEIGTVGNNAVHPRWQGRGIGTALIGEVVRRLEAAGVRLLEVATLKEDAAAQRVYEKLGFQEVTRTLHYSRRPLAGESGVTPV